MVVTKLSPGLELFGIPEQFTAGGEPVLFTLAPHQEKD
jgi:hypothetical protein